MHIHNACIHNFVPFSVALESQVEKVIFSYKHLYCPDTIKMYSSSLGLGS